MNFKFLKTFRVVSIVFLIALIGFSACEEDETTDPQKINITVEGFDANASVMQGAIINLQVDTDDTDIDMISVFIDGQLLESFTEIPFSFNWETKAYDQGTHKLMFTAYQLGTERGSNEIDIEITAPLNVTDYDGNVYTTVQIGSQIWMVENLKTTHYKNGDEIPNVRGINDWVSQTKGALCDYKNDPSLGDTYGHLYNFYTVEDSRGLCPEGWRVPTREDLSTLIEYLGGSGIAGKKMKEAGSTHWSSPLTTAVNNATNESGFTAIPGGFRIASGEFTSFGYKAAFWLGEGFDNSMNGKRCGWSRTLGLSSDKISDEIDFYAYLGLSVRCIKE